DFLQWAHLLHTRRGTDLARSSSGELETDRAGCLQRKTVVEARRRFVGNAFTPVPVGSGSTAAAARFGG
ncbi:MAG: hypothetical protein ACYS6K_09565, partial [Planctomycetota bacterium]